MAHASGNPTWQDHPSTETPITAYALEQIEAALDRAAGSEWQPLALQNGWRGRDAANNTSTYYAPACRHLPGDRVELTGTLYKVAGGANGETLATLPAAYRPARESVVPITDSSGQALGAVVRPDGAVAVYSNRTTTSSVTLTGTFLRVGPT